ncbi:unnamed protein product [Cunninghamella blakesleeana]
MTEMTCTSTLHNSTQESLVNHCTSAPLYELQEVIHQFKSHPELLKLILTSKVEEDKRRTEEAKLRAKELDYYLKHDTPPPTSFSPNHISSSSSTSSSRLSISSLSSNTSYTENTNTNNNNNNNTNTNNTNNTNTNNIKSLISPTLPPITNTTSSHRKMSISSKSSLERSAPYPPSHLRSPTHSPSSESTSLSPHLRKNSFDERRHSAAAAMVAMGSSTFMPTPSSPKSTSSLSCDSTSPPSLSNDETLDSSNLSNAYPSPKAEQYEETEESEVTPKPRRRREMQAITKIVETREFPYMDNYFWRNNGNTTQKKTGCRSIYYKCSNSNKVK